MQLAHAVFYIRCIGLRQQVQMKSVTLLIIEKKLRKNDKIIRFYHPLQDLRKVCTLVEIFYNGNRIEENFFFLEKQDLRNNTFELPIPKNKQSIIVRVTKANPEYNLSALRVEII